MTVRQIAELAGCTEEHVRQKIRILFPGLLKNGVPTDLDEFQSIRVMNDIKKTGFFSPIGAPTGLNLKKLHLSGALVRAMDSVYGKPGAAERIDFLIGFPGASGGASSTSLSAPQPLSPRDGVALTIGRRVLDKREREKKQGHLFPVRSEA